MDTELTPCILGQFDDQTEIIRRVQIGFGSQRINCTVRGSGIIGEGCYLENCFIAPYSSIADRVTLIDPGTDMEHSVILQQAKVASIHQRIVDSSVIGQGVILTVAPRHPKALRFMIGDDCQIQRM